MAAKKDEMLAIFKQYDKSNDGFVTVQEAYDVLKDLGFSIDYTKCLLAYADDNKDGKLNYGEFLVFYEKLQSISSEAELREIFKKYDTDKNDSLDLNEVRVFLQGREWSEDHIKALFRACDTNQDGNLQFNEFCDLMLKYTE